MKRCSFLAFIILFFMSVHMFPALQINSVLSAMKDPTNLIDEDFNTYATGKAGTNVVILQLGNLKYIKELKVYFKEAVKIKYFQINTSENFIEWRTIIERRDVNAATIDFTFNDLVSSFFRIVIVADGEFGIKEIEAYDTPAPKNKLTDIKITDITENSAVIKWQTKVKSQGTVRFMKKVNGTKESMLEADYQSGHSVNLKGLLKGTDYLVWVVSQSPDGTKIDSGELTFRTKGIPFPDIWELKGENITPFTAKIGYVANVPTQYEVQIGPDEKNLKKVIVEKKLKDRGFFELLGLQPESTYFYKLVLKDKYGNVVMTPVLNFTTPPYNIALGKKAIGTFNSIDPDIKRRGFGETTVDKVVDGNLNYFGGMAISYNGDNSDQFVVIDLEKPEPIKRLDVYWWGLSYSRDYRIDLSNDGKEWKTIVDHIDADKGLLTSTPGGDVMVSQTVAINKTARLVRLFVKAGAPRGSKVKKWDARPNLYLMEIAVIKDMQNR